MQYHLDGGDSWVRNGAVSVHSRTIGLVPRSRGDINNEHSLELVQTLHLDFLVVVNHSMNLLEPKLCAAVDLVLEGFVGH